MAKINRIHHVALVVEDLESALGFWRDALGLRVDHLEEIAEQSSEVAFLPVGEAEIELVRPTDEASGIARYLRKRGPGMHHICVEVDDIQACLDRLSKHGVRLINPEPLEGEDGKKYAFVHPESTHGVLVELYELPA